jgi:hypothetical protein
MYFADVNHREVLARRLQGFIDTRRADEAAQQEREREGQEGATPPSSRPSER